MSAEPPAEPLAKALAALRAGREPPSDPAFPETLLRELLRRDAALVRGILAYRRHPYRRVSADRPVLWAEGSSRLIDYAPGSDAPVVLVVPSLVNRADILDLAPGHSLLGFLAEAGVRPLLLDWGGPEGAERSFTLTDYIAGRLERALRRAAAIARRKVVLAGYCMGGALAVAAAQRRPDLVRALVLLATPWDFAAAGGADLDVAALAGLEPLLADGTLPVDALQSLFALRDPFGVAAKFRAFAALDPDSARARLFVALEDWLNDGVPLAGPVARACLRDWYGDNAPMRGAWRVAGLPVAPETLRLPAWIAAPGRDRLVPPESARPLAALIQGAVLHEPAAGHVGMVAGANAEAALWQPLAAWLRGLPAPRLPRLSSKRRRR